MLGNDTVGRQTPTTNAAMNMQLGGSLSGNSTVTYWPYTYYPTHESRIAQLEGEVKVLREMVVALLSGRPQARQRRSK